MIFLGLIALIPAGLIAVLALSKKTSPAVKKVSIIALVVIGLTFIVCTIIVVFMFGSPVGEASGNSDLPFEPIQEVKKDFLPVLIAAIAVLVFLFWITILAIRERRRKKGS